MPNSTLEAEQQPRFGEIVNSFRTALREAYCCRDQAITIYRRLVTDKYPVPSGESKRESIPVSTVAENLEEIAVDLKDAIEELHNTLIEISNSIPAIVDNVESKERA